MIALLVLALYLVALLEPPVVALCALLGQAMGCAP